MMGHWFHSEAEREANIKIGRLIEKRRKLLNMSQSALGAKLGFAGTAFKAIYKYETGEIRIPAVRLYAFAKALDVPIIYFFDGLDQEFKL